MEAFPAANWTFPNRQQTPIHNLIAPSLGRVYMKFWIAQGRIDP